MAYIGRGLDKLSNVDVLNTFSFTDSAGPYNITKGSPAVAFIPSAVQNLLIEVDGVIQASASYTITGSTITFGVSMSSSSTMNSFIHFGMGVSMTPTDGSVSTAKIVDDAVTTAKILDNNVTVAKLPTTLDISGNTVTLPASVSGLGTGITNAQLAGSITDAKITGLSSSKLTGALPAISGAALTNLPAETKPTITSISPSVITNAATAVVITGTNFTSVPYVDAINSSGAIVVADSVTYTSGTSITATFTLPIDGTYFLRVENPDGNSVRSATAILTVSDAPAWVTGSGSLGTFDGSAAIATQTLTATDATSFAITTGGIATGLTFTTGVGSCTITGTQTEHSAAATDSFTVTATDAEGQTADRDFSMSWTFGATGGGGFC